MSSARDIKDIEEGKSRKSRSKNNNNFLTQNYEEELFNDGDFVDDDDEEPMIMQQPGKESKSKSEKMSFSSFEDHKVGHPAKTMFKRNKKGILKPVTVGATTACDWKEGIQPQSARAGWIDESDSDNSDVFRDVPKPPTDSNFQIYLIVGLILLVISTVGSVKLFEFFYGKPKIKENSFDFLDHDDP